jgi:hypothetical protein
MEAADLVFGVFWSGTFLGIFELFQDMYENGIVEHPIWSSIFPKVWKIPIPHHLYLFNSFMLLLWIYVRTLIQL